jgi:putative PIN family toxin of toxin-antitoxin system
MRIMLDTNVLISALLFPGKKMDAMMNYIFSQHQLVLSSYVVEELKNVIKRKFPQREQVIDKLLMLMGYEFVYTPTDIDNNLFSIRDAKDYPVLYTAIVEDIDILITGDKDFSDIEIEHPKIMTPAEFIKQNSIT